MGKIVGRDASEYGTKASEDTEILSGCQVERIQWNKKEHTDPITIGRSRRKGGIQKEAGN